MIRGTGFFNKNKRVYSYVEIAVFRAGMGKLGIKKIKRLSWLKIGLGGILAGVGILTLPIPCGSFFMIGAGCSLMILGGLDLWKYYKRFKSDLIFWGWRFGFMFNDLKGGIKKYEA